jgi:nitrogenase subunit NifH
VLHPIRVDPALRQAPMHKQTIFEYAPESDGASDYFNLAKQLMVSIDKTDHQPSSKMETRR